MSDDVIDLTDSPDRPCGELKEGRAKRARDEDEEASKQAIMAFAKRVRQQQQAGGSQAGQPSSAPRGAAPAEAGEPTDLAADDEVGNGEEQARQRIMDFARKVNAASGRGQAPAPEAAAGAAEQGPPQQQGVDHPAAASGAPGPITNSLLAQLHAERLARRQQQQGAEQQVVNSSGSSALRGTSAAAAAAPGAGRPSAPSPSLRQLQQPQRGTVPASAQAAGVGRAGQAAVAVSILSWNLWFREDVEVEARMQAVGGVIADKDYPDLLAFQEVTPNILRLLQRSPWWQRYQAMDAPQDAEYFTLLLWRTDTVRVHSSAHIPFNNSIMGRDLKCVFATVGAVPLRFATTHLESPLRWDQLFSTQRVAQCKQAAALLQQSSKGEDIVFAGDMNWNPNDGQPPLPDGWCDAWLHAHPTDPGLTYDPKANPMLNPKSKIRRRLDRAFCRLSRWQLAGMELVGQQALPGGLRHEGRPVLPSDHFGLLLRLSA